MSKSFLIDRKVEREVMRTELFTEPTEVHLEEITHLDLLSMTFSQLRSYASSLRMSMNNITSEIATATDEPKIIVDDFQITIKHDSASTTLPTDPVDEENTPSKMTGQKLGKTSKYHYVYQTSSDGKYRAGILNNNKSHHIGSFDSEIEAARGVDSYLDSIKDLNRPRNRDEFPELKQHSKDIL